MRIARLLPLRLRRPSPRYGASSILLTHLQGAGMQQRDDFTSVANPEGTKGEIAGDTRPAFGLYSFPPRASSFRRWSPHRTGVSARIQYTQAKGNAQYLLDQVAPGEFTVSDYEKAKIALDHFCTPKADGATECADLALRLLERLIGELANKKDGAQIKWLCNPRYFNTLFENWRAAAAQGRDVSPVRDILENLQKMSMQLTEFRYNIDTLCLIMDVAILQTHKLEAPDVTEDLLHFILKQVPHAKIDKRRYLFNRVMQTWSVSGRPEALGKIMKLLQRIRADGIKPCNISYNIYLRFLGQKGMLDELEITFDTMMDEGVKPDPIHLAQALFAYANADLPKLQKAEKFLQSMIDQREPGNRRQLDLLAESVQSILCAYRKIVDARDSSPSQREDALYSAEQLLERVNDPSILDKKAIGNAISTLMDAYARAGRLDRVESLFQLVQSSAIDCGILCKAYSKRDMPEQATDVLKCMLQGFLATPSVHVFCEVINAWAESSRPDKVDRAFEVYRLLSDDLRCNELKIRPNTILYGALLKTLAESESSDVAEKAVDIIADEMPRHGAKVDEVCYNLAIKACIKVSDGERAELLMNRMEQSGTLPSLRTYSSILEQYSKIGTIAAAQRTELILAHMKALAKSTRPDLKPNVYCYNICISSWSRLGRSESYERVWKVYQQMLADGVEPSVVTFNAIISFFAKSNDCGVLLKATSLIECMQIRQKPVIQPDHRHCYSIVKAWCALGNPSNAALVLARQIDYYSNSNQSNKVNVVAGLVDTVSQSFISSGDLRGATVFIKALKGAGHLQKAPSVGTYTALLNSWRESNLPEKESQISNLEATLLKLQTGG